MKVSVKRLADLVLTFVLFNTLFHQFKVKE